MNTAQVIPFLFESHEIRTQLVNDQPWFCIADVCRILGYVNSRDALAKHCREKGVAKRDTLTIKGKQSLTFINEGNLYRLIIKSRKEEAQRFESWVCDEILPTIRKHGQYQDTTNKLGTLIGQTIGTDGFHILGNLVAGKVRKLPPKIQRSARMKIWSQLHTAYGVKSAEDIPAEYLDGARQFIAAYAIEGEYLPFQGGTPSVSQNHLSMERSVAYGLVTHAYQTAELLQELEKGLRDFSSPLADQAISQAEGLRMFAGVIKGQNGAQFEAARVQQERMRAALASPRALN